MPCLQAKGSEPSNLLCRSSWQAECQRSVQAGKGRDGLAEAEGGKQMPKEGAGTVVPFLKNFY